MSNEPHGAPPSPPAGLTRRSRAVAGFSHVRPAVARLSEWASARRLMLLEAAAVVAGTVALTVYVTWPVALNLNDEIFGLGGDSTGTIWWLWWMADDHGFHILGVTHHTETGWPFGWDQGNGVNIQWALLFFPAYLVTEVVGEVVAYNVVVLSGLVLSGVAMYILVRKMGAAPLVAGWAALVYIVFPWHLEKAGGHAAFTHLEVFPLLVLALLAWQRQPSRRLVLYLALITAVAWTTSGYFGIIEFVGLGVILAVAAIGHSRRFGFRLAARSAAAAGGAAILVVLTVLRIARLGFSTSESLQPVTFTNSIGTARGFGSSCSRPTGTRSSVMTSVSGWGSTCTGATFRRRVSTSGGLRSCSLTAGSAGP